MRSDRINHNGVTASIFTTFVGYSNEFGDYLYFKVRSYPAGSNYTRAIDWGWRRNPFSNDPWIGHIIVEERYKPLKSEIEASPTFTKHDFLVLAATYYNDIWSYTQKTYGK